MDHDQLYAEFDAQVQKFIELVGKVPDYIHAHAYGTATTEKVRREIAQKYNRPYSKTTADILIGNYANMGWYIMGSPEAQLKEDLASYIVENRSGFDMDGYGYLITHCGYADAPLFEMSSFNLCRVKDLEALTSDRVKNWIKENNIELITYNDLDQDHWSN